MLLSLTGPVSSLVHLLATPLRRIERRPTAPLLALAVTVLSLASLTSFPSLSGVLLALFLRPVVSLVGTSVAHSECLLDRFRRRRASIHS